VRTRNLVLDLLGVAGLVLGSLPAAAHFSERTDPNDPGALDIRKVTLNHKDGMIVHTVTTDGAWTPATLAFDDGENNGANDNDFELQYETKGDTFFDFLVVIDTEEGELVALLYRWTDNGAKFVEYLKDPTKDGKTVKVKFARSKIDANGNNMFWSSASYYTAGSCNLCRDRAPNQGGFEHNL